MQGKYIAFATIALAVIGIAYFQFSREESKPAQRIAELTPTIEVSAQKDGGKATTFENGHYSAVGEYETPAGKEKVGVTVTLIDGVVSEVDIEQLAKDPTSIRMQGKFASAYAQEVVGKPLNEIELDVVGGSSLTPNGFEDALEQIKKQAAV